jgi:DNA primase
MIDRLTVDKIKETANIVEVVSEFVTLKKSGANYKGLCPFHNEKTPSFIVSPARGTCHCFGCGKGGNSVSFIMEHEQLTYPEALRWLAKKYGIEIHERDLTDKEREQQNERESMFIVNEWAADYFEWLLHNDKDGIDFGMQYFRDRGFRDDVIRRFRLGYDLKDRYALATKALKEGHNAEYLVKTGLCYKTDRGDLVDRYSDRVIFPWIGLSGKVVGFSARVLDSRTKGVSQKYVNSPDSEVYHKERELFGIYQAKKTIAKEDRVFIVEGQTDVISMFQCGIENVVANSGTALSIHQIHMLHRFTSNITLLYDGDSAGLHAAMRGTDMLLSEGINVKVLFLPDGDDPDGFARKHTAAEFCEYVERNQEDFLQFKINQLLKDQTDPQLKSQAIDSIIHSIAVIPNQILRDTYIHECASFTDISEMTLINRMNTIISQSRKSNNTQQGSNVSLTSVIQQQPALQRIEKMIAQMVVRNGEQVCATTKVGNGEEEQSITVAQFFYYNLMQDNIQLKDPVYRIILEEAAEQSDKEGFIATKYFINHHDIEISQIATQLSVDKYTLILSDNKEEPASKYDKENILQKNKNKLFEQANHLTMDLRLQLSENNLNDLKEKLKAATFGSDEMKELAKQYSEEQKRRNYIAKLIGQNLT